MFKEWLKLGNFPILNKSGLRLRLLQLQFLYLFLRKPVRKRYPDFHHIQNSKGVIWISFNSWLRFQLQFIDYRFWAGSPLIRAVALVNLSETYEQDAKKLSREELQKIEKIGKKYADTFKTISHSQFKNWILRNYLIVNTFSDLDIKPTENSECLVEIGPGLGAIISLSLNSKCKEIYSYDTFEMLSTFSAITERYPKDYERVKKISINDTRNVRPFKLSGKEITLLAFWSFTELTEEERIAYYDLFKSAKRIIIGTNEKFESIDNFKYIEEMAKTLRMTITWRALGDIFATEIPAYQKKHRIYLLQDQ